MCGICGQFNFGTGFVDKNLIKNMSSVLMHRGPDGNGFYFDGDIGLGHRRLSIIDLITGHQPMSNEDGTLWIVANGEIYNFIELRKELEARGHRFRTKSDTEVIIHLYEDLKEGCVEKLSGMFAFAVWDKKEKRLFIARDRLGIKPLYYFHNKNTLIFASEIKALLKYKDLDKTLDPSAIDQYFSYLYIIDPYTIFKNIKKLPAGHYLICDKKTVSVRKYWDIKSIQEKKYNERYYINSLKDDLNDSVKLTLRSDVPVGIFLSGGIDSTAVTGISSRFNKSIKTFSVVFKEHLFSEQEYSRLAARRFNTDHHELVVTKDDALKAIPKIASFLDEPFADSSCIPTYFISKFAKSFVKVVLTGEGGDELFAGYSWHSNKVAKNKSIKRLLTLISTPIYGAGLRRKLYSYGLRKKIHSNNLDNLKIDLELLNNLSPLDKLLYMDLKLYLPSDMLTKVDRMSMMNSLEARLPMLNHAYVESTCQIHSGLKLKNGIRKYIFKKTFGKLLPQSIIDRPKMGFSIPLDIWLWQKDKFRDMVYGVIFDAKTRRRGYFNYRLIKKMYYEHERLLRCHGHKIWALFMFELWHRNFMDK